MDHKAKAKVAWQRSLEVVRPMTSHPSSPFTFLSLQNPKEWAAQLLLGLEAINVSKNSGDGNLTEEERAHSFLSGTKMIDL